MRRTLEMSVIEGIHTTMPLHVKILSEPDFVSGNIGTGFMDRFMPEATASRGTAAAS
jgi:acetyl-CoA carboxylase biotin carboxylase subunit